jgi:hypothetical protein
MSDFKGFPPRPDLQGYTAIPNIFFDEVLPNINNMSELKILLAVFRKTYGWVKEIDQQTGQPIYKLEDAISYSQFEDLTGLSSSSIATGLTRSQNNGYLEKVRQGNYSGVTSSYKIVTSGGERPEPPKPSVPKSVTPKADKPSYFQMDNSEVEVPKTIGRSLAEFTAGGNGAKQQVTTEKEDMVNEILGVRSAPAKKETKKEDTPHQVFIRNWLRCYYSKFNVSYGNITGKEHGHIKGMLKDFDIKTVIKGMEFYFNNYQSLDGVPSDYPNISIFYAWRKKIITSSTNGIIPAKRNAREFKNDNEAWGDDFFDN